MLLFKVEVLVLISAIQSLYGVLGARFRRYSIKAMQFRGE